MDEKNKKIIIDYWLTGSEEALEVASAMFNNKSYNFCLFFYHLTIEKRLKAEIVAQSQEAPPYIHNLVLLARHSKLPFSDQQILHLKTITKFNLNARYDTYKRDFYKLATLEYATKWVTICEELLKWINNKSQIKS